MGFADAQLSYPDRDDIGVTHYTAARTASSPTCWKIRTSTSSSAKLDHLIEDMQPGIGPLPDGELRERMARYAME